tara:strand:- start:108 stop:464 length:357 start_codon:yes stop_codon:yes gene_type:complete
MSAGKSAGSSFMNWKSNMKQTLHVIENRREAIDEEREEGFILDTYDQDQAYHFNGPFMIPEDYDNKTYMKWKGEIVWGIMNKGTIQPSGIIGGKQIPTMDDIREWYTGDVNRSIGQIL